MKTQSKREDWDIYYLKVTVWITNIVLAALEAA
jgi:hypothetical protein